MPVFHASHYLRGQFLGDQIARAQEQPLSHAFFCSQCGDIWYRIAVGGQDWCVEPMPCDKHSEGRFNVPPGSIAAFADCRLANDASHIDYLPPAVIRREFELTLAFYEMELV